MKGIFTNEKELNQFMEQGILSLIERFHMPASELANGLDFCRTLMAEYSRLLEEGKIKRPYTYSASRPNDESITFLAEEVISGRSRQ